MRTVKDDELQGHAMIFSGPLEIAEEAARLEGGLKIGRQTGYADQTSLWSKSGRGDVKTWPQVVSALNRPFEKEMKSVLEFLESLRHEDIPEPKSRLRKARWTDNDGEIDVDRVMRGSVESYREVRRETYKGPTSIAVICNTDGGAADVCLWRSITAVACVDLLEARGYGCEVHLWCRGRNVYSFPNDAQFTTCPIKQADAPFDLHTMLNSLSAWFLRAAIFGSFGTAAAKPQGIGGTNFSLGRWIRYMDVTDNMAKVYVPVVHTRVEAVEAARKIVTEVVEMTN